MRLGAWLAGAEFTLLSRSGSTGRTSDSECLFGAEFFCHTNLTYNGMLNSTVPGSPSGRVYTLLTTDMGRFCRKALISALFICSPPL
jgi:hypothetical protein